MKEFIRKHREVLAVFLLFWVLTFPAYQALLKPGMLTGHDTEGHLVRLMEFSQALDDGHFPVRWSKRLDFGLGYPFFNFNYPFVYYLSDAIHRLGFDFVTALKITMLLSFPLGGFFSYLWLRRYFRGWIGFIGGFFYTLVPYHFLNVYVRGALGEVIALTLVPLVFYFIDRLFSKPTLLNSAWLGLAFAAVVTSHNITAMVFSLIWLIYTVVNFLIRKDRKEMILFGLSTAWGMALAAFFLLPALLYKQYTNLDFLIRRYFVDNFPSIKSLIYSPWAYGGSKVGIDRGEMSFQIGLLHQLAAVLVIILLVLQIKQKLDLQKRMAIFFAATLLIVLFLTQEISLPVWKIVTPLQYMEFPWRLLSVVSLSVSFLATYLLFCLSRRLNGKMMIVLGLILLAGLFYLNRNHWRANEYYTWIDYWQNSGGYSGTTTKAAEHIPKWHNSNEQFLPYIPSRVTEGQARVENLVRKTNLHRFRIEVDEPSVIVDRTDYFPGWNVYANGSSVKILDPYDPRANGLIAFNLLPGEYIVDVRLEEAMPEKVADAVSLSALMLVLFVILKEVYRKRGKDEKRRRSR